MTTSGSSDVISLPKGGGALHGIGEKFSPDLHTGTGNFTVPIALPAGRNGFQPQLNLIYSTGNGNGPFGLGWNLSIPGVARKTSKGVPRYDNARDTFILSGAEDLVPVAEDRQDTDTTTQILTRYRPRTEGLFARIEHHHVIHKQSGAIDDYWEVGSKDGLVSFYGTPVRPATADTTWQDPAIISNPDLLQRDNIFAWKLTETGDPFGNRIAYEYTRDRGEDGPHRWDQLYLSKIRYVDYGDNPADAQFLVTVEFVYEQRPDPHSEYRSGFEIRTRKRCARILVHTHAEEDQLVRTYDLIYLDQRRELTTPLPLNGVSLLSQIKVTGHDGDKTEMLPPLEFGYSRFEPEKRNFFPLEGSELPGRSLASPDLELVDLFGHGLPDLLEMNGAVRYWRNLGDGRFDLPRFMQDAPAGVALADAGVQFVDANGDGRTDLLVTTATLSGYYPLSFDGRWDRRSFQRYRQAPSFNLKDPEVKLVDLDGDGVTDAIRSGTRLECFFNDPKEGWNKTRWLERQALEVFPNVNFSDLRVKWADITGDGLQDIALVCDGNVEYWPNLGHGNWGKRIHMENSPHFPWGYDPRRILVGDVDGDGLADIVYVDDTKVTLWINQSGNSWSDPITILGTPPVSDIDAVRIADVLGSGISGVLWSRDANGLSREHLFFLDFTGGLKPYLLDQMDNHIGAVTKIEYVPSTRFYLEDQERPETRWKTTLPFPVQVVSRVEVIDYFSRGKLTTEYRYHHGYWDGAEREFRGFGMVEQLDTELFEKYSSAGLHGAEFVFTGVERQYFSPPTLSKTWFHQGPVGDEYGDWQELDWSDQYWSEDPQLLKHTEKVNQFLATWPPTPAGRRTKRDALRALRGATLRTELYALDGSKLEQRPYTVTESSYSLIEIEPPAAVDQYRRHVFFPYVTSQRTTQWERGHDPMTRISFTRYTDESNANKFDPVGRPLAQTEIACPRGWKALNDASVEGYLATRQCFVYGQPLDPSAYIHDRVAKVTSYEVVSTIGKRVTDLEAMKDSSPNLKLIGQTRNFYDGLAYVGLPLIQVGKFGALTRTERLVLTDDVTHEAYGLEIPPYLEPTGNPAWNPDYPLEFRSLLPQRAGYTFHQGGADASDPKGYFVNEERRRYDFQTNPAGKGRGLVFEVLDPLHDETLNPSGHRNLVAHDKYQLLPVSVTDAAGLTILAAYDYRVLQPREITDANGNQSRFTFSPLGLLKYSLVQGKSLAEGDHVRPGIRLEYGFRAYETSLPENRQPIFVRTVRQIHHDAEVDVPLPDRDQTITTVEYSDGFGRLLQTRTQGEEVRFGNENFGGGETVLPVFQSDGPGGDVVGRRNDDAQKPNVVVSGWQVYDNKGRVVQKYEPFFSEGWTYGRPDDSKIGQKVTMFYDPRGHTIRTLNPDGSEQRVIFGVPGAITAPDLEDPENFEPTPWEVYTYDANDNAGRTHPAASSNYKHHWNTPASVLIDALGRTIETVKRNRDPPVAPGNPLPAISTVHIRTIYDIRGNVVKVSDALGRAAFRQVYDYANNPLLLESIDGGTRKAALDAKGALIEQRDSRGALVLHSYDNLNRPLRLWARDGQGQALTLRQRLEYGDAGTPNQPAVDRATNRAANRLGRLFRYFDEAGLLIFEAYDFKGKLLQKTRRVVSDAVILDVFTGPPLGWEVAAYRVDWTTPSAVPLDPWDYTSTISYDALSRIKLLTYPLDVENRRRRLRPCYNRAGALERVELEYAGPAGIVTDTFVDRIAYNAKGQRVLIAYGNGIMTRQAYDVRTFRLLHSRTERYSTPSELLYRHTGVSLQEVAYQYDSVGNISEIHDRAPDCGLPATPDQLDCSFTYDALYQLRSATGRECDTPPSIPPDFPWGGGPRCADITRARRYEEHYQYDAAGNIAELNHAHFRADGSMQGINRTFALVANTNRLETVTFGNQPFDYSYDGNGNVTRETTSRHFEWDYADRMRVYRTQTVGSEPSIHAHYLYDTAGQRVKKLMRKQSGQIEVTIYIDGIFEYQRAVRPGTVEQNNTLHVMDDQSRIATVRVGQPLTNDLTPAVKYQLSDHLGSSNVVVDDSGNVVNREEYTPYGETSFGSFARKRYRFTGKEVDEESGLTYFGARYYSSWLGRWTSCDPAGAVDGPNLYSYVTNNPIRLWDAMGTDSCESSAGGTCAPDATNVPPPDNSGVGSGGGLPTQASPDISYEHPENVDAATISLDVHDLPDATPDPAPAAAQHEAAGTYSNSPPGGVGEAEWTNLPWEEGTGPFIEGFGTGVEHAAIDLVESATATLPDMGQHELLENQKSAIPAVPNDSGFLGWFMGFALANAVIIFGMARMTGGGGGGGGGGKDIKLNLGGEGEAAGYTDVNPLVGNKLSEAEIVAKNPTGGFVRAGAEALPFESESVSEIIANKLPPTVVGRNASKIASEMKRVLKRGGTGRFTSGSQLSPETKAIFEKAGFTCNNFGCSITK